MITSELVGISFYFEIADFSDRLDDFDFFIVIDDTDTRRIIATILQALESCEDFFAGLSVSTQVSEYTTHILKN